MEYTEKLAFPIPQVTRGGDVNDVIDIVNTIHTLLNYIDTGTGDYLVRVGFDTTTAVEGDDLVAWPDLGFAMIVLDPPEDGDVIAWTPDADTPYAKINEDGTVLIKAAGNYNVGANIAWTTSDTDGFVVLDFHRTDVDDNINNAHNFKEYVPITGEPLGNEAFGATPSFMGQTGVHFFQEGAVITPKVYVSDPAAAIDVTMIGTNVERL